MLIVLGISIVLNIVLWCTLGRVCNAAIVMSKSLGYSKPVYRIEDL